MKPISEGGCSEIRAVGAHGPARPPALVPHVKHLHGSQVLVAVVAADGEYQRPREEMDAVVGSLADERLAVGPVPGHGRSLRVPQEVEDGPEVLRVPVEEYPAVPVAADVVTARQQGLQVAALLLHQRGPGRLEDGAPDVQVDRRLRRQHRVDDALAVGLEEAVLLLELFVLVRHVPAAGGALLLQADALLVQSPPVLLQVCLHGAHDGRRLLLCAQLVLSDFLHLALLLGHELLPDGQLLVLERLPVPLEVGALLLDLALHPLQPADEAAPQVAHHLLEVGVVHLVVGADGARPQTRVHRGHHRGVSWRRGRRHRRRRKS
mmetsp:Transcript_67120/g.190429  ORF Transcript_67120/g.190429 Transcript_67120/m.190429 type:complete len:321 (-) Transcript_67120:106-1068(-)